MTYETRSPYPQNTRDQIIAILNGTIANLSVFKAQAKNAHWNNKGILFYESHLLFDRIAGGYDDFIDRAAERLVSMGGIARGTEAMAVSDSPVKDPDIQPVASLEFMSALIDSIVQIGTLNLANIEACNTQLKDQTTLNLLAEVQETLDNHLFLLESHLQKVI